MPEKSRLGLSSLDLISSLPLGEIPKVQAPLLRVHLLSPVFDLCGEFLPEHSSFSKVEEDALGIVDDLARIPGHTCVEELC